MCVCACVRACVRACIMNSDGHAVNNETSNQYLLPVKDKCGVFVHEGSEYFSEGMCTHKYATTTAKISTTSLTYNYR